MTTYPLSEPATIYAAEEATEQDGVAGRGTLADCVEIIEGFPAEKRASARIEMDDLDLRFGPRDVDDLLRFLRDEDAGLSNQDIAAIENPDR
ncbi:hypothetical protein [Sphingomonas sp. R86521]|uniref:hypothetical protein n=1 Tax=Sphingomonas sp. R86521 TaxID=3093860 RepID=UPI0036D31E11